MCNPRARCSGSRILVTATWAKKKSARSSRCRRAAYRLLRGVLFHHREEVAFSMHGFTFIVNLRRLKIDRLVAY